MDITVCTPEQWVEHEESFLKQLQDESVWNKIPLLNINKLQDLQDRRLVRFRGMIQDMHSPEYYFEKYEVINDKTQSTDIRNGKYCEAGVTAAGETINLLSDSSVTAERHIYVVISVPGLNNWAKAVEKQQFKLKDNVLVSENKPQKRVIDAEEADCCNASTSNVSESQKKVRTQKNTKSNEDSRRLLSKDSILNFPLPNPDGKACHIKLYKNDGELKLNQVCDFVGFLDIDPLIEAAFKDDVEENRMELETLHPPSSLVPRIHCVEYKHLKHCNPLIGVNETLGDRMELLRTELSIVLTQLLLGDELAAEYLICHLISEVYLRRDFMPLGKFSLNISNIPTFKDQNYIKELYRIIEQLVPQSYYLPMTLDNMNDLCFIPKKDYECNRLTSGVLQLSNHTHLVLDETMLTPGQLKSSGVDNVKALIAAIKDQKLSYNFNFYNVDFECDIPILILSEGKSMVGSDVHVVLLPEPICMTTFSEILQAADKYLNPELLNDIRKYLTLARSVKYEISTEAEDLIQKDFVHMRQDGCTGDDLHKLLVLARLLCISQGKTTLDRECWKKACDLEQDRKARISP